MSTKEDDLFCAEALFGAGDVRVVPDTRLSDVMGIGLDEVPDGYRTMNDREAIKVMVKPGWPDGCPTARRRCARARRQATGRMMTMHRAAAAVFEPTGTR